jgi:hypothetical protein
LNCLSIKFEFENIDSLSLDINSEIKIIPEWTKFKNMSCPGNITHGPDIDYCRLGADIDALVEYFSTVKSIERGSFIVHCDSNYELHSKSDAQTIFFNAFWFIILHSKCSTFKYNQSARSNYMPSSDPEQLFYVLFSIFVTENFIVYPETKPNIEKFKKEVFLLFDVINNLISRIRVRKKLKLDTVENGLTMLSNLTVLIDIEFEEYFAKLQEKMKKESLLEEWK